ncbi:amino acid transporter AVT1D-like [Vigna radiata var. radiata]|uniref:Amino acid transporter AVT1D-like n=1 Tax=Vigna radiata var. radiata TaxID=3916 RepID=A0A1S3TSB6_VIGRR|nr:amino acid transporter AVT1D-like [Vigna radiata var. radiata]
MQRGKVKLDEDLRPDREDDFQTDDEENQAQRVFEHLDDDTDSDNSPPSPSLSNDVSIISWPQSYRQSMDMLTSATPPGINLLKRFGSVGRGNSPITSFKRSQEHQEDSTLSLPLVSDTCGFKQENRLASAPRLQPLSSAKFSVDELPPPHEQCSYTKSVINGTNILCGIGLLTTPYAIKEGGFLSLAILLMFAIMCCYTGMLLIKCLESNDGLKTYPDIGQAAFGIVGRLGIAIFLYVELFASCVEYIILVSDNLSSLYPNTQMKFGGIDLNSEEIYAITAAIIVLPTVWLRNLSLLSYISVGGIFATILVALCLFWVGTMDQVVGYKPGKKILDLASLPVSVGLYSFCFAGHAVFPNIYSSMKEPSKFPSVLFVCFGFCTFMYMSVGIMGYLTFGDLVSSQFTLNMPKELYASEIATWTTVVTPLAKYALTLLPIALSIEELATSPRLRCHAMSVLVRTTLVILSLLVALYIPYFGSLMALIGSFLSILVALIYPCACFLKLHRGRLSNAEITICGIIIVVGLISACMGTLSAVSKITGEGD